MQNICFKRLRNAKKFNKLKFNYQIYSLNFFWINWKNSIYMMKCEVGNLLFKSWSSRQHKTEKIKMCIQHTQHMQSLRRYECRIDKNDIKTDGTHTDICKNNFRYERLVKTILFTMHQLCMMKSIYILTLPHFI